MGQFGMAYDGGTTALGAVRLGSTPSIPTMLTLIKNTDIIFSKSGQSGEGWGKTESTARRFTLWGILFRGSVFRGINPHSTSSLSANSLLFPPIQFQLPLQ